MHGLDVIIKRNAKAAGREAAAAFRDGDHRRCNKIITAVTNDIEWSSAYWEQRKADNAAYGEYQP
jgi:hypothetical protein